MKKPQARSCSNGHHADWVREPGRVGTVRSGTGAESHRGREKGVFCPGSSSTAHTGRTTHYFSVLFLLRIFFFVVAFVLFFKKALRSATGYIYKT